jgi:hypothetical protein
MVLRKSADDPELAAELDRVRAEFPEKSASERELIARGRVLLSKNSDEVREGSAQEKYQLLLEQLRRANSGKSIKEIRALAWGSLSDDEQI